MKHYLRNYINAAGPCIRAEAVLAETACGRLISLGNSEKYTPKIKDVKCLRCKASRQYRIDRGETLIKIS